MLGAAGIIVFDDSRDIISVAHNAMEFFAEESCGKCFPCRIGTQRLTERLAGDAGPMDMDEWRREVSDISETMKATSACGLGMAAPLIAEQREYGTSQSRLSDMSRAGNCLVHYQVTLEHCTPLECRRGEEIVFY